MHLVKLKERGIIDLNDLEKLLQENKSNVLVSLMHGNNEVGNMIDLEAVNKLCKQYGALFHSDTVQTMSHFKFDFQKLDLDFLNQLDKWAIPFALIFTKADKEPQAVVAKNVKLFLERLRKTWQFLPQHFVSSANKKLGKDKILTLIDEKNEATEEVLCLGLRRRGSRR
jgi:GTP-binding protein EngB required for normal cell division